jgi:[acyl-carrier-protein] S-malonyltransferase
VSKSAFLFPGQGAQVVGMGRTIHETVPAARGLFDQAATILGYDLANVCFHGPEEKLNSTAISQPAIFVASLAALESMKQTDAAAVSTCEGSAGLSLGEYTALVFAGVMSFADGLRIVKERGEAMQTAADMAQSGMVSILGLEQPKVEEVCEKARTHGKLSIANLLGPGNIVVSGDTAALAAVVPLATEAGAMKCIPLTVAGAFHTDIMRPADEKLAKALSQVELRPARIPVWSNVDGNPHTEPAEIKELLVRQVLSPVLWEQSMRNMLGAGFDKFYEIGPGRVLAGLLKRIQRKIDCQNIQA